MGDPVIEQLQGIHRENSEKGNPFNLHDFPKSATPLPPSLVTFRSLLWRGVWWGRGAQGMRGSEGMGGDTRSVRWGQGCAGGAGVVWRSC